MTTVKELAVKVDHQNKEIGEIKRNNAKHEDKCESRMKSVYGRLRRIEMGLIIAGAVITGAVLSTDEHYLVKFIFGLFLP